MSGVEAFLAPLPSNQDTSSLREVEFEEIVEAYFKCRKNKRNTQHALRFEIELERNLFELFEELKDGRYEIGRSVAFVVDQPKTREIWAAQFRDRIVHHLIYQRLWPVISPGFIRNSFACIPERGALDASNRLWAGMRSLSWNWQRPGYFLSADVKNFFVGIHKPTLWQILERKAQADPWILNLTRQVLFHDPRQRCIVKSKPEAFARVARSKSLWFADPDRGLPIGNLTSQFFANVYLNELDQFVTQTLQAKRYYRYVDDFVILHESPTQLNEWYSAIDAFLRDRLKIELHPFKKRLAPIDSGVDFVGFLHKPYRRYPSAESLAGRLP